MNAAVTRAGLVFLKVSKDALARIKKEDSCFTPNML
jgi:hypothetical protein